jgi:hypothetical protein
MEETIFFHFSVSTSMIGVLFQDESMLIWYSGKQEKQLKLSHVSRIIPGQRTVSLYYCPFFPRK